MATAVMAAPSSGTAVEAVAALTAERMAQLTQVIQAVQAGTIDSGRAVELLTQMVQTEAGAVEQANLWVEIHLETEARTLSGPQTPAARARVRALAEAATMRRQTLHKVEPVRTTVVVSEVGYPKEQLELELS